MTILRVENLGIAFGGVVAVDGVSFTVNRSEIFALIGPNGAGKTTLFNMISGVYVPQRGRIVLEGADVTNLAPHQLALRGMSRTFQNLQVFFRMTAAENVMVGRHVHENHNVFAHVLSLPSVHAQNRKTRADAERLLAMVGLAKVADSPASSLSYGALKRLEIARALAAEPRVLLLDEPAAGCNPVETEEIDAVIQKIAGQGRRSARQSGGDCGLPRRHGRAGGGACSRLATSPAVTDASRSCTGFRWRCERARL